MKKLTLGFALLFFSLLSFAQTNTYDKVMAEKIAKMEGTHSMEDYTALSNDFLRIADKEQNKWLPYYYAALTTVQKGRMQMTSGKTDELDQIADNAQKNLDKSIELGGLNSENLILKKMIHSLRMMVNPMTRFMTEGAAAMEALAKAEGLDPDNPRISLLRGEDTYFTPEQFGGSKEKGRELVEKAVKQFESYKPESSLHPNWGREEAKYMLEQVMK